MNKKEEFKLHIMKCVVAGKMTIKEAAERLKLSIRQVKRLKEKLKKGVSSLLHGNCGRQPKRTLSPKLKEKILKIKAMPEYENVNFLHFQEKLEGKYKIKISYSALRELLIKNNYESPRKHRERGIKHTTRKCKEYFGEMLQMDGSKHRWFKNDNTYYTIHGAIDDATGNVTGLYMCKNECLAGYTEIMFQTINSYGVPKSIYTDGLSTFFSSKEPTIAEQLEGKTKNETQFGKMMSSLGVYMIHARSSQAKGKIERLWGTLQGRLETEFAIEGIKTAEEANAFFPNFLKMFNARFSVEAVKSESNFLPKPESIDLDILFAYKMNRVVDNGGCFSVDSTIFQCNVKSILPKTKIEVLISKKLGVKVLYKNKLFTPIPILKEKRVIEGASVSAVIDEFVNNHCLKDERTA
jgi:transposase